MLCVRIVFEIIVIRISMGNGAPDFLDLLTDLV